VTQGELGHPRSPGSLLPDLAVSRRTVYDIRALFNRAERQFVKIPPYGACRIKRGLGTVWKTGRDFIFNYENAQKKIPDAGYGHKFSKK